MSGHVPVEANHQKQQPGRNTVHQKYSKKIKTGSVKMIRYVCVTFALLGSFLVAGLSEDEAKNLRGYMTETTKACMTEFGISIDDFEKAKDNKDWSGIEPCFIGCIMKAKGLIDAKGMFDKKASNDIAEKFVSSPEDIAKIKKVSDICNSVNEQQVTDGNKGCERSILLMKCLFENKNPVM